MSGDDGFNKFLEFRELENKIHAQYKEKLDRLADMLYRVCSLAEGTFPFDAEIDEWYNKYKIWDIMRIADAFDNKFSKLTLTQCRAIEAILDEVEEQ